MNEDDRPILLFAANSSGNLANFRAPIIAALKERGYTVAAAVPEDEATDFLRGLGVQIHTVSVDARGLSPWRDIHLVFRYVQVLRRIRPAAFLTFTPKPNIYGAIAAGIAGVPTINTVTGLGTGFLSSRLLEATISLLYRIGLRRSHRVFFHNPDDRDLFVRRKLIRPQQSEVVPGSGVNLDRFRPSNDGAESQHLKFLFIGRLLRDKGALEFAQAAELVRKRTKMVRFQMLGPLDDHPRAVSSDGLERFRAGGTIELLGAAADVRPFIADADCVVLPSYREGLPRVILEACAMATPVIATDVPGCRQAVDHGISGLLCEARSSESLTEAMMDFVKMSPLDRAAMGVRARQKAEREFSEERVVAAYLEALSETGLSTSPSERPSVN